MREIDGVVKALTSDNSGELDRIADIFLDFIDLATNSDLLPDERRRLQHRDLELQNPGTVARVVQFLSKSAVCEYFEGLPLDDFKSVVAQGRECAQIMRVPILLEDNYQTSLV